ncbi:interferon-induced protein 44-like, partial [Mercenaria mercenaria]|uniref:interferon-induced protein 44-like n=1 Tax=Mercenaria mercenaria TaxID=6596 RepID=UPI00234FB3D9
LFNSPFIVPEPEFTWSSKYSTKLLEKVSEIVPPKESGINKPNILLLGAAGSGKSSFINSIATASENRKVNLVPTAANRDHVTTVLCRNKYYPAFEQYRKLEGKGGTLTNYVFADVKGLSGADTGIHIENIMNLIQGHIKEKYEFKDDVTIPETDDCFIKLPEESDKFQCVVFVFDCRFNPSTTETLMKDIFKLNSLLHNIGVPRVALLTHIDKICPKVRSDIRNTFYSKKIKEKLTRYAEVTGLPEPLFYPIKNYEDVRYPDPMTNIPLLLALEACLNSAMTYLRQELPGCSASGKLSGESDS